MVSSSKFAAAGVARFAGLVHDEARRDAAAARRHIGFIASHVIGGCAALLALPVYLAIYGQPTPLEAMAFAWFVSPIAIALYLSRTGRLETAQAFSAANMSALVAFAAALTGGMSSFLLPWMALVPFEAALSMSRRVVTAAILCALTALAVLAAADLGGVIEAATLSAAGKGVLMAAGLGVATLYAGSLALSINRAHADKERALRDADADRRTLAESASDLILRHSANGMVSYAASAAERFLGAPPEELLGDGLLERVHNADRPAFLMAFSRAATKGATSDVRFRLRHDAARTDGDAWFWAEMRCRRVAGEAGTAELVSVIRDVTHQKKREDELATSRDEAEEGGRDRARFLAGMNHELRTPLNAIIGFADVMCEGKPANLTPERNREYAEIIRDSGYQLLQIVNDIVDVSRLETGSFDLRPEPVDLAALARSCAQAVAKEARAARIKLDLELPGGTAELVTDARACQLVFRNALGNALMAANSGGTVKIALRSQPDTMALEIESRPGKDNSSGETGDAAAKSGIMGLAVLNTIAGSIGATFETASAGGSARRITVSLPRQQDDEKPEPAGDNIVPFKRSA